jgi:adenylosuccinate synthase
MMVEEMRDTRRSKTKFPYTTKVTKSPFKTLKKAKMAEKLYSAGKSVGFTAVSSLKSMGRVKRTTGWYELGAKYAYR